MDMALIQRWTKNWIEKNNVNGNVKIILQSYPKYAEVLSLIIGNSPELIENEKFLTAVMKGYDISREMLNTIIKLMCDFDVPPLFFITADYSMLRNTIRVYGVGCDIAKFVYKKSIKFAVHRALDHEYLHYKGKDEKGVQKAVDPLSVILVNKDNEEHIVSWF